jgi:3-deoxy-D-manno-octulosonate 8-phosphate phosphatase (KDO 8-P phosphatase)
MNELERLTTDPSRVNPLQAIICDVDGTLTDGCLFIGDDAEEFKCFDVRDGLGIVMALRAGLRVFFLTSRPSNATQRRARELGVTETVYGRPSKLAAYEDILFRHTLTDGQVCFIGDDLTDLVLIKRVLLGVAVGDAHEELCKAADLVCERPGGRGAVREVVELILKVRGDWERIVKEMDPSFAGQL